MRILILHSAYLSGPASGENRGAEDEARLLREAGHEIRVPSLSYEGSPRTDLEAYAAGVPVIANNVGAFPKLVHEGLWSARPAACPCRTRTRDCAATGGR